MNHLCYMARLGHSDCAKGLPDRAHLIPRQRLAHEGLDVDTQWDRRVWIYLCRRHHHLFDHRFLRLTRDQLPSGLEAYAQEHGLGWSLDRDYGEREVAA